MPTSAVVPRASLSERDVAEMFSVFERSYENVDAARFRSDLAEKEWVVILRDGTRTVGFSTIMLLEAGGERAVFSGDTIVDRAHWDSHELPRTWGRFVFSLRGDRRLWWFLISKGYRTYLYLPLFFREFWPRQGRDTPEEARARLDTFARRKYPQAYEPRSGLIRHREPHGNLRPELAEVPVHRRGDADVRFFLERNPDFRAGTELACLAEIAEENLGPAARRLLRPADLRLPARGK